MPDWISTFPPTLIENETPTWFPRRKRKGPVSGCPGRLLQFLSIKIKNRGAKVTNPCANQTNLKTRNRKHWPNLADSNCLRNPPCACSVSQLSNLNVFWWNTVVHRNQRIGSRNHALDSLSKRESLGGQLLKHWRPCAPIRSFRRQVDAAASQFACLPLPLPNLGTLVSGCKSGESLISQWSLRNHEPR